MKSVVEVDIHARQPEVTELFGDPRNNPKWMDDLERIEPVHGEVGEPGSVYRMVPKKRDRVFLATILSREPEETKLLLDAPDVSVEITDRMTALTERDTRLVSEETFRFKGLFRRMIGLLGGPAIRAAHRRHMESFKRFAESQG